MGTNYTTINHVAREELGLSWLEYGLADLIYNLSNSPKSNYRGWCYTSKSTLAGSLGINERRLYRLLDKLEQKNLIEKDPLTRHLKVTIDWYNSVVIKDTDKMSVPMTKCQSPTDKMSDNKDDLIITFKTLLEVMQLSPRTLFTPERRTKLKKRLQTFTMGQLEVSARNIAEDSFMSGDNPREKKYGTIDYFLRNDENVDKWLNEEPVRSLSIKEIQAEGELLI